jgi:hypothetical protein
MYDGMRKSNASHLAGHRDDIGFRDLPNMKQKRYPLEGEVRWIWGQSLFK